MAVFQSEDRQRMRRLRSEKAIQLAMQNKWQEAADLNRQILSQFPDDVDTLNRLGKALMELGQYADARDQYQRATKLDPSNGIATTITYESSRYRIGQITSGPMQFTYADYDNVGNPLAINDSRGACGFRKF